MNKIKIFKGNKEIDLSDFIDSRALICANSGGGKSYTARKILEESHGKVMSIVLDIEGEFKTLREKYDFLLIGEDGDIPLNMKSAPLLPKKLLELNVPTIIDISELKKSERVQYVKKFIEALMEIPRSSGLWKPCLIVLDEIHNLAGQQEKQDSTYAVIDLATRGRKRGYCLIGCTQRISKLHKDVVAELNNYFVGRTSLDLDMKRSADILGFSTKQDMLSLRDLDNKNGEFYVFGPSISSKVEKECVDVSKTTHPKRGTILNQKVNPPTEKVKALLKKMGDLPKEAAEELKTKQDLLNKVKELNKAIREKPKAEMNPEVIERLKQKAYNEGYKIGLNQSIDEKNKILRNYKQMEKKVIDAGKILGKEIKYSLDTKTIVPDKSITVRNTSQSIPKVSEKYPISNSEEFDEEKPLGICARKIYSVLYGNQDSKFTKIQIALFSGYSPKTGSFINSLSELNTRGLIKRDNGFIFIGDVIEEYATEGREGISRDLWSKNLGICARKIFEFLLENETEEFSRDDIADSTGYSQKTGSFINSVSKLNSLGLIKKNNGMIRINPEISEL